MEMPKNKKSINETQIAIGNLESAILLLKLILELLKSNKNIGFTFLHPDERSFPGNTKGGGQLSVFIHLREGDRPVYRFFQYTPTEVLVAEINSKVDGIKVELSSFDKELIFTRGEPFFYFPGKQKNPCKLNMNIEKFIYNRAISDIREVFKDFKIKEPK